MKVDLLGSFEVRKCFLAYNIVEAENN